MTLHAFKNSTLASNFDFVANPIFFTANSTGTVNIVATSTGRALAASGTRLWDQTQLGLNTSNSLVSGQNLQIPFIASNLPTQYFDAIILLTVDGVTRLPYAFSNSPDNTTASSAVTDKILYWTDLWSFGLNGFPGNNNTTNNYMFGGTTALNEAILNYKLNFSSPLPSALTYSWQIRYVSYTLGLNPYTFSGTTTAAINSLSSTFFNGNIVTSFFNNSGIIPYQSAGYYVATFTVSDTNYRSLLNKYHWGVAS